MEQANISLHQYQQVEFELPHLEALSRMNHDLVFDTEITPEEVEDAVMGKRGGGGGVRGGELMDSTLSM